MKKSIIGIIAAIVAIFGVTISTTALAATPECYVGSSDTQLYAVSKNAALYTMLVAGYDDSGKMVDYEIVRNKNNNAHFAVMEYDNNLSYRAYLWDMGILRPGIAPTSYLPDSDFQNCSVTQFDGELIKVEYDYEDELVSPTATRLDVYKNENTNATVKYRLSDMAKMYVNGTELEFEWSWNIVDAILSYASEGTVTLVDIPSESSGYVDGIYDYILVDYYATGVIDEVYMDGDVAEIIIAYSADSDVEEIVVDPEDEGVTYSITDTEGNPMSAADIPVGAVVSVAYNVNYGCYDSDFYNIIVSTDTVEGMVESTYTDTMGIDWFVIDGVAYKWANVYTDVIEAGTCYTFYLDKDGNIGRRVEKIDVNIYAIVDRYFESAGDSKVRLVHMDGTKADYIIAEDNSDAQDVLSMGEAATLNYTLEEYGETGLRKRFVTYTVNKSGEVALESVDSSECRYDSVAEYRAVSSRVGSYTMDENTVLLDATAYASNCTRNVDVITAKNLENRAEYDVVALGGRDSYTNTYPAMIFISGSIINKATPEDAIVEEGYAIVDRYFESAGDSKVRLVHADGKKTDYIIAEDNSQASDVLWFGESLDHTLAEYGESGFRKRFVKYAVNSYGEVVLDSVNETEFGYAKDAEFDKTSGTIGDYIIGEDTVLLSAVDYAGNSSEDTNAITIENLEDETDYDVVLLGTQIEDIYPIMIFISGSVVNISEPETIEEGYAVVDRYYTSAGNDMVKLLHMNGTKTDYTIKEDNSLATDVLWYSENLNYTLEEYGETGLQKRFVKYGINKNGEVILNPLDDAEFSCNLDAGFNESTSTIGEYLIDENTTLLDASAYVANASKQTEVILQENLKNAIGFGVVAVGKKDAQTGAYPTIMILYASIGYSANTRMAIVESAVSTVVIEGMLMDKLMVLGGDGESKAIYADQGELSDLREGDAIIYYTNLQGQLEGYDVIYSVQNSEYKLMNSSLAEDMFGVLRDDITFSGENGDSVRFEIWPILKKYTSGIDLATDADNDVSAVSDMGETYDYAADVIAYEYDGTLKKNWVSQLASPSLITASRISPAAKDWYRGTIVLTYGDNELAYALVRLYDGEIKEIYNIYFN